MEHDRKPSYVHKISDMVLLDAKEDYYPSYSGRNQNVPYKKLVVPSAMRSIYWKFYGFPATENNEILTRNKIVCLLCKSQMIYNRNTSNLRMHLQNKHKDELETLELVQPLPSCKSGRTDQRSARRGSKVKRRMTHESLSLVSVDNHNEEQSYTLEDGKYIADAVSEFIISDLQCPEVVEGKGFQRFIATLKSPCEIPSKTRLTDEFIPKIYESVKEQLQPDIASINTEFSLSVEDWVSSSGDVYSTVCIHVAQLEDGEFQTKILSNIYCSGIDPFHWGAQWDAMVEEWEIKTDKVKAVIVSSDREDVYETLLARNYLVIPCLGHTLQAACMEGCFERPDVAVIVRKCRSLISLVNAIPSCHSHLRENEAALELEKGGFDGDTPPLWSSTYTMLEQLLNRKEIVESMYESLAALGIPTHTLQFDINEWSIISDIIDVLSPFKVAMSTLYEERIPLISILKPLMQQLKKVHLETNKFDTQFAVELKTTLAGLITSKYDGDNVNDILDMSCALDPRFKNLPFLAERYKAGLKDKLRDLIGGIAGSSDNSHDSRSSGNKKARLSGMEYLLGDLCGKNEMPSTQRLNLEIVQFECEPPISLETSPIQYWKDNQGKFPNISKIAMQYLCIPVCVNNYLNSHFNSKTATLNLSPQMAHKLRFIYQNNMANIDH